MRLAKGFTLIEVLVALFILTGAILVIANTWSGNFMRMRKATYLNDAATLLERKMAETEGKYKDKPIGEILEEDEGDFGKDHPNYRWAMKSRDLKLPDLSPLMIGQGQEADETMIAMIKQMTEFLSQAIKEVKVSIFLKRGNKELEFFATQYFVDYNKEFAMGGPGGAPAAPPAPASGGKK